MNERSKVLIVYYSRTGNTRRMAEYVAEGVKDVGGEAKLFAIDQVSIEELNAADALIIGSPTHYGHPASEVQQFFDRSVAMHGRFEGKVGAAFTSAHNIGGGNETAILHILESMLVHGMIIQGDPEGDHYGPVAIGVPDRRAITQCRRLGVRLAGLCDQLRSGRRASDSGQGAD
jgi:NAD(P)H dehydrogenase (quinone)